MHIPDPLHALLNSSSSVVTMDTLLSRFHQWKENPFSFGHRSPSTEYALGYPINTMCSIEPWDRETQTCYIESLFLGLPLQPILIHTTLIDGRGRADDCSDIIIHGQHELNAIQDFIHDQVPIFNGGLYSQLSYNERKRFNNIELPCKFLTIQNMHHIDELTERMIRLSGEHRK